MRVEIRVESALGDFQVTQMHDNITVDESSADDQVATMHLTRRQLNKMLRQAYVDASSVLNATVPPPPAKTTRPLEVIVYGRTGCTDCERTERALADAGVSYEKRLAEDVQDALVAAGARQVPVVVVTGAAYGALAVKLKMQSTLNMDGLRLMLRGKNVMAAWTGYKPTKIEMVEALVKAQAVRP